MSPDSEFPIEEGSLNGDIPSLDEEGSSAEAEEKPEEQTQWPFINVHAHVEGIPLRLVTGTFNCLSHTANLQFKFANIPKASGQSINPRSIMGPVKASPRPDSCSYTNKRGEKRSAAGWEKRREKYRRYQERVRCQQRHQQRDQFEFRSGWHEVPCNRVFRGRGAHRYV